MTSADLPGSSPDPELTTDELIKRGVAAAYGAEGYVTEDGEPDHEAIIERLFERVLTAEATTTAERAKVAIPKRDLMTVAFPQVPGPEAWAEQDDPELAEGIYLKLEGRVWTWCKMEEDGPVQQRLNSGHGLVLCRTKVNPHRTDAVYVTRDWRCITADLAPKYERAAKRNAERLAQQLAMVAHRIPQHGKPAKAIVTGTLRGTLTSGTAAMDRVLEANNGGASEGADE